MTRAMASSSHEGTPSVSDVRRARAARFSFSPAQCCGSPSFSLGLEKCPPPPTFDDCCGEKDLQRSDEKQNLQQTRLPDRAAAPSFSLGLEDIQAPPTSEYCREKGIPCRSRQSFSQRQEQQTRKDQQFSFSTILDDTPALPKSNEGSGTDSLKTAEERWTGQGRSSKDFSGPSFSLGLERSCSPAKCDVAHSRQEEQPDDLARIFGDRCNYPSSRPFRGEHPSLSKSGLLQLSREHSGDPKSKILQNSLNGNSSRPKWDSSHCSGKVTSKQANTSAPSNSLFDQKVECSPKSDPSVKSSEEPAPKQMRRSVGPSPPPELTGRLKTEPTSDSDVTCPVNDQEVQRKRVGRECTSPERKKIRPPSRSESSPGSHEDRILEPRLIKDGRRSLLQSGELSPESKSIVFVTKGFSSTEGKQKPENLLKRSRVPRAVDSTKVTVKVTPDHPVGPIPRREGVRECETGERLPHTHLSPIIDLSPERVEKLSLEELKWSQGRSKESQSTPEYEVPVGDTRDSKVNNQQTEKDNVYIIDVSTPPSLRLASNRPLTKSHGCLGSEVVLDSEEELEFDRILKRRRLSKLCSQVKTEPLSTNCLEDLTCPPTDRASAAGERTPATPIVEHKKVFRRLRRGSSSSKDSPVNKVLQDRMDRYVALEKVKPEPSDPPFGPNVQNHPSVHEVGKQITDGSHTTSQDEFDDIEDSSEYELHVAGVKKPVLHIPGLDTSVVPGRLGKAKAEPVTCLDTKFSLNLAKETGNVKSEPITLSDDEVLWHETSLSRVLYSQTFPAEVGKGSTSSIHNPKLVPGHERAVSGSNVRECSSGWKGKSPIMDGSDLWKSYTEHFSADDNAGLAGRFTGASSSVYKRCQSEDVRVTNLLRERLPHFKPVDALLLDGGLDQEPVYIDYRNQFGRSQGMDSAAFAELDCSQPQSRRKQKRPSSKSTKGRKVYASSSATISSQRTTASKSPSKGKRKAWTLFRETKGRASTSVSTSDKGYWIVESGRKVYVKDGRTLTGRSAYAAYSKDSGKKSRRTKKKPASRSKH